jgi:hypothetical protein
VPGDGTVRAIGDLLRWGTRRPDPAVPVPGVEAPTAGDRLFPTKAFPKFLSALTAREAPALIDLGPVVGSNVAFFGERLGCKIFVEDLCVDVERHARNGTMAALPELFTRRFPQAAGSIDGILCWDLFDYLDRPSSVVLARELVRLIRPGGAVLGFFSTAASLQPLYTKYVIIDEQQLRHRTYAGSRARELVLLNRDIIRMFDGLLVSDSFLLKINTREILFRKR